MQLLCNILAKKYIFFIAILFKKGLHYEIKWIENVIDAKIFLDLHKLGLITVELR